MRAGLASSVDAYASESGETRSAALGELLRRGLPSVLAADSFGREPVSKVRVAMPDGPSADLDGALIRDELLPTVARTLCDDGRWLDACPGSVREDMAKAVASAAAGLGMAELPWNTLVAVAKVLASDPDAPWMVNRSSRMDATKRAGERIRLLEPLAREGELGLTGWRELAWRSAASLVYAVADVAGRPPSGPVSVLASILSADDGAASDVVIGLRHKARQRLISLLGVDTGRVSLLCEAADAVARGLPLAGSPETSSEPWRDAALVLASAAMELSEGRARASARSGGAPSTNPLSRNGARKLLDYVSAHPRATTAELLSATGLSRTTLRRRIAELEEAGLARNAGSASEPLWEVPGVEHAPEELLTQRQVRVLAMMRQDPPMNTADIAAALGISISMVTKEYHRLAQFGLAEKRGRRWRAHG